MWPVDKTSSLVTILAYMVKGNYVHSFEILGSPFSFKCSKMQDDGFTIRTNFNNIFFYLSY